MPAITIYVSVEDSCLCKYWSIKGAENYCEFKCLKRSYTALLKYTFVKQNFRLIADKLFHLKSNYFNIGMSRVVLLQCYCLVKEIAIITISAKLLSMLRCLFRYLVIVGPRFRSQGRPYTLCSGQKCSGAGFSAVIIFCELSAHQCPIIAYQSSEDRHWALKGV